MIKEDIKLRHRLIESIRDIYACRNDDELLNILQECGYVSSSSESIHDCSDSDLVKIYNINNSL